MKPINVFLFLLLVLLSLVGISFLFPTSKIKITSNLDLKYPSFKDVFTQKVVDTRTVEEIALYRRDSIKSALKRNKTLNLEDSLSIFESFDQNNEARLFYPNNDKSILFSFFRTMDSLRIKDTAAHILHYGDSQIEEDRITGYLRERFQALFGGKGVGLVSPRPLTTSVNMSHYFSSNWIRKVAFGPKETRADHYRYGPMYCVCSFDSLLNAHVSLRARKKSNKSVKQFNRIKVFYNKNVTTIASGNLGKKTFSKKNLGGDVKLGTWSFDTFQRKGSFSFKGDSLSEVYALSLESKMGVYVDNIAMRGASGLFFKRNNKSFLKQSLDELNTQMIILEFGGNVLPVIKSEKTAKWYGEAMKKQILYLKKQRPEATIFFIGPADMLVSKDGKEMTHPYLEKVIIELKKNVLEAGGIYWDMYRAMGGQNSMLVWQKSTPKFGSSDGIHFTRRGAQEIARLLFETIENEYNIYNLKMRLEEIRNVE